MEEVIELPYSPRKQFERFHTRQERWALIVAHRRAGKTVACINDMIKRAIEENKPNGRYAYIAPYYNQAKTVAWDYLLYYTEPIRSAKNASELWVELVNGSRIRLYGADNADAMRGQYFDGLINDEYGDWKPGIWGNILRPALADRQGWAVFIGTPKGRNEFYELRELSITDDDWFYQELKASETKIVAQAELTDAAKLMTKDQYAQEFECSFDAAVLGAIYANYIKPENITKVAYDPRLQVHTAWDLGVGDSTAIWFIQVVSNEYRVIDYYENSGEGLGHYIATLQNKNYIWGNHYAPHDIQVREFTTGQSRLEIAESLGIKFTVVAQHSLEDGINATRMLMPNVYFDEVKTKVGLEALKYYRWRPNERLGGFTNTPEHDWSSHGSDAFRYFAMGYKENAKWKPINYKNGGIV
jgi:phage terminase large subunit